MWVIYQENQSYAQLIQTGNKRCKKGQTANGQYTVHYRMLQCERLQRRALGSPTAAVAVTAGPLQEQHPSLG